MKETIEQVRECLKKSGLTVKQAVEVLEKCKSEILNEMPIDENLNSKISW